MSGLILAFVLWYVIMTAWLIHALIEPSGFKNIIGASGFLTLFAITWWLILIHEELRDKLFDFLGYQHETPEW